MSSTSVQFSVATHIMAVLAFYDGVGLSSMSLAESVNAEASFVRKTVSKLAKAGLVLTTRGKHGHCTLAREAGRITLRDIYLASEAPHLFAVHGYAAELLCPVSSNIQNCMTSVRSQVQCSLEQALEKTTLADLLSDIRNRAGSSGALPAKSVGD